MRPRRGHWRWLRAAGVRSLSKVPRGNGAAVIDHRAYNDNIAIHVFPLSPPLHREQRTTLSLQISFKYSLEALYFLMVDKICHLVAWYVSMARKRMKLYDSRLMRLC